MLQQNKARGLASAMARVYNWLYEYQKGPGNWFVFCTAKQGDYVFAGHGNLPDLNKYFYVECILASTAYNGITLRFLVDESYQKITKAGFQVGWKMKDGSKIENNVELARKLDLKATGKQEEHSWFAEGVSEDDIRDKLCGWLNKNAPVFKGIDPNRLLHATDVLESNRKFLEKLKVDNFIEEVDGLLSVPDAVRFSEIGNKGDSSKNGDDGNQGDKMLNMVRDLLRSSHQVILTGAPGTGKTYLAKKVALAMLGEQYTDKDWDKAFEDGRVGFCQFHPSYDYSDFVEGLRPIQGTDGQVGFKRMDGVFKKMCKDAIAASRSGGVDNFDEVWKKFVDDLTERNSQDNPLEIKTDSTMFKVFLNSRNNLSLITSGTDKVQGTLTKAKIRVFYVKKPERDYWACYYNGVIGYLKEKYGLKPYQEGRETSAGDSPKFVFIIDEINRGDISKIFGELFFSIDPGYRGTDGLVKTQYQNLVESDDAFSKGFYVPENVYIIGTMNDIDRSVESMDFAIRRRFVWKEVEPDLAALDAKNDAGDYIIKIETDRTKASERMVALNDAIKKCDLLGSAYQLGQAYFLKLDAVGSFDNLWEMNLEPLLREYLRGNPKDEIDKKINSFKVAYDLKESESLQRNGAAQSPQG